MIFPIDTDPTKIAAVTYFRALQAGLLAIRSGLGRNEFKKLYKAVWNDPNALEGYYHAWKLAFTDPHTPLARA